MAGNARALAGLDASDGCLVHGRDRRSGRRFFWPLWLGLGLMIFAFISTYRLTDYVMGVMTNPFYIDMGFSVTEVGVMAKFFGWPRRWSARWWAASSSRRSGASRACCSAASW